MNKDVNGQCERLLQMIDIIGDKLDKMDDNLQQLEKTFTYGFDRLDRSIDSCNHEVRHMKNYMDKVESRMKRS